MSSHQDTSHPNGPTKSTHFPSPSPRASHHTYNSNGTQTEAEQSLHRQDHAGKIEHLQLLLQGRYRICCCYVAFKIQSSYIPGMYTSQAPKVEYPPELTRTHRRIVDTCMIPTHRCVLLYYTAYTMPAPLPCTHAPYDYRCTAVLLLHCYSSTPDAYYCMYCRNAVCVVHNI